MAEKIKYKLAFVNECKKKWLWYKTELEQLFTKYGMQKEYDTKIKWVDMQRWYPEEVFAALERA